MCVTTDKTRVSAYITNEVKELAEKVAARENRSLSNYIENLIKQDLEAKGYKF